MLGPITVRYFDVRTGDFSDDLSDHSWNQMDLCLLATVPIRAESGSVIRGQVVKVTVAKGKKVFLKQTTLADTEADTSPRFVVPVWIVGPFCEDLSIQASIFGQSGESAKAKEVLQFRCGE